MIDITVRELVLACGGSLRGGDPGQRIRHISLDSRHMEGDDLFVPVVGEKVDAHDYICQAIGNGAAAVFTSRHKNWQEAAADIERQCPGRPERREKALSAAWIYVEHTKGGLQAYGTYCRERNPIPLVGVTGSVGKTTTREMVAAALSAGFEVYKTPGNSNSQVGVPITIAQIPKEAQIGVIELGMSEPGEIQNIARVAQVNVAVITNIGIAHIEQLGSKEAICREKLDIQQGMAEDGLLLLNGDDPMLRKADLQPGRRVMYYGLSEGCHYRGTDLSLEDGYPVFTVVHGTESVRVRLHVMGSHMVLNAIAAIAAAAEYKIPMEAAARALEQFEGYKGRQQISHINGLTLIDDSYNASPASMKGGLEVLCSMPVLGRRVAVLADMKELGKDTVSFHREIGDYIAEHPFDFLLLYGELASCIGGRLDERRASTPYQCVKSLEEAGEWLKNELHPGDCVLLKGSNSMKLSRLAAFLRENFV